MTSLRLLRPLVPTALLVLACGDSGGGSAGESSTGVTGVTGDPGTSGATDGGDATDGSASASATQSTSSPGPTDPTTTTDPTGGATGTTVDVDPFDSSTGGTTWDSFGDDTGPAQCKMQIDIVFVMDVSTSMSGILQKLEDEILTVDAKLKTFDVLPDVHYGLVVFVDDAQIIDAGAPYLTVEDLKADFNYYWKFTQSNSQVSGQGFNGDFPENTLDALFIAAGGFQWRPVEDTLRLVIHTTDDTFGEKGAVQSGVTIQRTYDETVMALQDKQIRVFAFADNDMTGGPDDTDDVSMGFFTPYNGKTPIPEATDGGAFNINLVNKNELSLSAAINESVEQSLCEQYIPM